MAGIQERRTTAWETARDRLNWTAINAAVEALAREKKAPDFEIETARKCIFTALERWLAEDLMGVDWKTSRNTLGSDWRDRYVYSWQGPTYADGLARKYHRTPRLFQYRGIARSFETKPVLLEVDNPAPSVEAQYGGLRIMRDALVTAKLPVWPKSMPSACKSYGRECPYWTDCTEGKEPRYVPEPDKIFSFSSASTFLLCPEKYRRNLLTGSEDSEDTIFGNMVHVGLAEAYKQVQNWNL